MISRTLKQIDTFLLENYPLLWNTKLVWILPAALVFHLIFFLIGFVQVANPDILRQPSYLFDELFYRSGMMLFSVIVSILLLVYWLVHFFKHNAFKDFYPLKSGFLYAQFACIVLVIFASTSYYLSYKIALSLRVRSAYPLTEVKKDIALYNEIAPYFSNSFNNYAFYNKSYPPPLPLLHNEDGYFYHFWTNLDSAKWPYDEFEKFVDGLPSVNEHYFYTWNIDKLKADGIDFKIGSDWLNDTNEYDYYTRRQLYSEYEYLVNGQPAILFLPATLGVDMFKYRSYVNPKDYYTSFEPSYLNYAHKAIDVFDERTTSQLAQIWHTELTKQNKAAILKKMDDFFLLAKKYKIEHNLPSAQAWLAIVFKNPVNFEIAGLIKNYNPQNTAYPNYYDGDDGDNKYLYTPYFIDTNSIDNVFNNIGYAYKDMFNIYEWFVFLWIAAAMALLIFIYRTTNLRSIIFSVVTASILLVLIALLLLVIAIGSNYNDGVYLFVFTVTYLALVITSVIGNNTVINKTVSAVAHILSLVGFVPFILMWVYYLYDEYRGSSLNSSNWLTWTEANLYWLSYVALLLFVGYYIRQIIIWRANPDN